MHIVVFKYFLVVVLAPLAVAAGVYYFSDHWLPLIIGSWENLDTSTKRELLKVAPTAVAAMFGSIVAAVTAVIVVWLQRNANLRVERHKGDILAELEEKKKTIAGELDTKSQELTHQLGLKRLEIDEGLNRLNDARSTVSEYRYLIQRVKLVGYAKTKQDIEPLNKKLIQLRDSFGNFPELRRAWADLHQKGHHLCERMEPLRTIASRQQLWAEISQGSTLPVGIEFGNAAEQVLTRLGEARTQVLPAPIEQPVAQP